jgi:glutamate-ammonia-ligase adenylyltransferase
VPASIDPALRLLTRLLMMFRLVSPDSAEPPEATRPIVARACGFAGWSDLLAAHAHARQTVAELWRYVQGG